MVGVVVGGRPVPRDGPSPRRAGRGRFGGAHAAHDLALSRGRSCALGRPVGARAREGGAALGSPHGEARRAPRRDDPKHPVL